jgi:EAL domain-containing protein (putative c-di-GMP-specific phosphodiesterase class I)
VLDCGDEGIERLRVLRVAGVGVALDDFGTGFSSLGNLRTLPIDQLKVDRTFVAEIVADGVESALVDAVVRLGAALGVGVVAEGIEDAEVAQRLAQLGCPFGQGYLFGRPQPIEELSIRFSSVAQLAPKAATTLASTEPGVVVAASALG